MVRFFKNTFLLERHNDIFKSDILGFALKCCRKTLGGRGSWGGELGEQGWHSVDIPEAGDSYLGIRYVLLVTFVYVWKSL